MTTDAGKQTPSILGDFGEAIARRVVELLRAVDSAVDSGGEILTVREVIARTGYSRSTIVGAYRRTGDDRLVVIRHGRSIRVRRADLDAWLARGRSA